MMSAGYTQKSAHKLVSNVIENKNYISEVIYCNRLFSSTLEKCQTLVRLG